MHTRARTLPPARAVAALVAASLALAAAPAAAQERIDTAMVRRIREEAFDRSRVLETATLLSDLHGPRVAGSPGYHEAAQWVIGRLREFGVPKAGMESWGAGVRGWAADSWSAEMTAPRYLRLHAYPKAWTPSTEGVVAGTPLLANITNMDSLAAYRGRLRGAIVLVGRVAPPSGRFEPQATRLTQAELDSMSAITDGGEPRTYWEEFDDWSSSLQARQRLAEAMKEEGVAAVVEPSGTWNAVRVASYAAYMSDWTKYPPAFVVAREHWNQIARLTRAGVPVRLALEVRARAVPRDSGYNVVAEIPGTDPRLKDEVVMLGGHFDSWSAATGATDNASGAAVGMEVLRILNAVGARPRRTIRLALWDGEEVEDYFGSMGYVKRHFGDPETMRLKPEHRRLSAYFNYDFGSGRIRGFSVQGNADARPVVDALLRPFHDLGATTTTLQRQGSTDVMPFFSMGLPAFNALQDPLDYSSRTHHTSHDVPDFLIEDDLKQSAAVLAGMVLHTANRDALMPRAPLPAPRARP
jgi:carboxypeptidase Q